MYLCSILKTQPLIPWIICIDVRLPIANQKYCTCDRETLSAGLNINGKYNITNLKAFLETIMKRRMLVKVSSKAISLKYKVKQKHIVFHRERKNIIIWV